MGEGGVLVPGGREIDRRGDAFAMQRVDLGAQQVEAEAGVHPAHLGRVVGQAVMALGKDGDRVDVGLLEGTGEVARVEAGADALDQAGGVEVEMDLAKAHDGGGHL